ncbi:MAG: hypothetical protein AAGI54_03865 [Planctomycetota bacterium]
MTTPAVERPIPGTAFFVVAATLAVAWTGAAHAFTRPATPPASADDLLVSSFSYDEAGRQFKTTDPSGQVTATYYDDAGRVAFTVENFDNFALSAGLPTNTGDATDTSKDRVTAYTYRPDGQQASITAVDPDGDGSTTDNQDTYYVYEGDLTAASTLGVSPVSNNSLLRATAMPDAGYADRAAAVTAVDGTAHANMLDVIRLTYHADGSLATRSDQRGVLITFLYDDAGRRTIQSVTTLNGATWTVVGDRAIKYSYTAVGQIWAVTTHSDPVGQVQSMTGSVEMSYDGLQRPLSETQTHGSPLEGDPAGTVTYTYDITAGGNGKLAHGGRLIEVVYPNGREIHLDYATGDQSAINDAISRLSQLVDSTFNDSTSVHDKDTAKVIAAYSYMGSGRAVIKDMPQARVRLDYTGDHPDVIGTQAYGGLDGFGRIARQLWDRYDATGTSTANPVFDVRHAYDRASNRLDAVRTVYRFTDDYGYDGLHRLTTRDRDADVAATQVGLWTLDNTWNDDSGNANHGTAQGTPSFITDARFGTHAARFEDAADFIDLSAVTNDALASNTDSYTYSAWLRLYEQQPVVPGKPWRRYAQETFAIRTSGEGTKTNLKIGRTEYDSAFIGDLFLNDLSSGGNSNPTESYGTVDDFAWHHVALRFDDATDSLTIHLDGEKLADHSRISGTDYHASDLWKAGFFGDLDDIQVFDDALSQAELAALSQETAEAWNLDQVGNWSSYTRDSSTDTRTHNSVNEITSLTLQGGGAFLPDIDGSINWYVLEAEDFVNQNFGINAMAGDYWEADDGNTAGLMLRSVPNDGDDAGTSTDGARLDFPIDFAKSGTHWLQVRMRGADTDNDSINIGINGVAAITSAEGMNDSRDSWHWEHSGGTISVPSAGVHTFNLWQIEDGVDIDRIVLSDASFSPLSGGSIGPDVSSRADISLPNPAYDAAGNMTHFPMTVKPAADDQLVEAVYDAWNRIVAIYNYDAATATRGALRHTTTYDGLGRRIILTVSNHAPDGDADRTEHHYYDGQSIVEDRNGSGQVLRQRVWGSLAAAGGGSGYIDELIQLAVNIDPQNADVGTYTENRCHHFAYALHNANYNVMGLVTTVSATLIERYEYTPYGERTVFAHPYELGDGNFDGKVDGADNTFWANRVGTDENAQAADYNGDGTADGSDYTTWANRFGHGANNDPLCVTPADRSASISPYATFARNPIGHQGLWHDEHLGDASGLIHNRARVRAAPQSEFLPRDGAEPDADATMDCPQQNCCDQAKEKS